MKKIKMVFGVLFLSAFLGVTAPAVGQTAEAGTTQTADDDDDNDDSGKLGLLGLLGLAGLLGLRRKDDDRGRRDNDRIRTNDPR